MVSHHQQHLCPQLGGRRFDRVPQPPIRLGRAIVGEVAGQDQRVDAPPTTAQPLEDPQQHRVGIHRVEHPLPRGPNVGVGELHQCQFAHDAGSSSAPSLRAAVSVDWASLPWNTTDSTASIMPSRICR